jgi:ABC-type Fe3+-siderophore transport system permease subunit
VEAGVAVQKPSARATSNRFIVNFDAVLGLLTVALVGAMLFSMSVGAVHVSMKTIVAAVVAPHSLSPGDSTILMQVRLPRIIAAAMVGAALSIAGLLFQGLFRNPMADPYVIGSSGGAALGASIGLFLLPQFNLLGFSTISLSAFIGSIVTIALVYWLARTGGRTQVVTLLLAGFGVSTMLSYSTYFLDLLNQNYGLGMSVLVSWFHGTIDVPRWTQLGVAGVMVGVAGFLCFPLARRLNTLALGEEYAQQLGINLEYTRIAIVVTGSLLVAAAVSLGGLISFVGLVVPHLVRLVLGPDNVRLLPVTAIAGALFLVLTDTAARTLLAPTEIPVGVLSAFIGGPFFLYLLRRTKREYKL